MKIWAKGMSPCPDKCMFGKVDSSTGLTKEHRIHIYPGSGSVDGFRGDHIILAPAYNITNAEVDLIVDRVTQLVETFFDDYDRSQKALA